MTKLQFVRFALRRASLRWGPIWKTRLAARKDYKGPNKRQKFEYQCNCCKEFFPAKSVQVDHIQEVGTLLELGDLPGFVDRLLCEQGGLQVLCLPCHKTKTQSRRSPPAAR